MNAIPAEADLERLSAGTHHDPHAILGAHAVPGGTAIRTLRPGADKVAVRIGGVDHPLEPIGHDVFAAEVPIENLIDYRLVVNYPGQDVTVADGYRFLPTIGEVDLHLIGEGRHERLWDVLGAHPRTYTTPDGDVSGTSFAVWAPAAVGVTLIGEFEGWGGHTWPMRALGSSGVWELFAPDIAPGSTYKFRVHGSDGSVRDKADPMAFATELPPATASRVTESSFVWTDEAWLAKRAATEPTSAPLSIYEVHAASWRPGLTYRELADQLVEYLDKTQFTHVELLPVAEHPFGGSWGYQVTSYYAPTSRFGSPDDFRYFVDRLHTAGYGVLIDWVPAHFPKDDWALARFDGSALYEHPDPRRGEQLDWGTYVFDFGRTEVRNFLVANALYWVSEFHVDGLRVDAVASMIYLDYSRPDGGWEPNKYGGRENLEAVAFLQEMNATVHKLHPGVLTIAEESTAWPGVTRDTTVGGLGFSMKWNMGWMHDTLGYMTYDPVYRSYHHHQMTFSMMYAYAENYVLPISHDEVVHGKGTLWSREPGDDWSKAAGVRNLLAYMWAHPGKQLLFMGQEFGQQAEWSDGRGLDWWLLDAPGIGALHRGIQGLVGDLNRTYRDRPALYTRDSRPDGFEWIDANDNANNVFSFLRYGPDGAVVACMFNFSGSAHADYRIGLPFAGEWDEILNTDAEIYGGSGVGNLGRVTARNEGWHGRPASAQLVLPPLGAIWLAPHTEG
ncbi:1,4-alpha-glucan branching protein GlgB [Millisia brevis]|uniref:1,4-alpha-glucan branching protein GlgB n=1 Tax=Millisia brevis TaxID=264148 RepID=UPI000832BF4E|nr:1,4-alpha-glucan branching protein GlgB [Millisia brevis]